MERTYRYSTFMRDEILQTRIYRVCKLNLIVKEEQRGRRGNEFSVFDSFSKLQELELIKSEGKRT